MERSRVITLDAAAVAKLQSQYSEFQLRQVLAPITPFSGVLKSEPKGQEDYIVLPDTFRKALKECKEPLLQGGSVVEPQFAISIAHAAQQEEIQTKTPTAPCSVMVFRLTKMFCGGCVARVTESLQSHVAKNMEFTRLNGLHSNGSDLRLAGLAIVRFGDHLDYLVVTLPQPMTGGIDPRLALLPDTSASPEGARAWWVHQEVVDVVHRVCEKGIAFVAPVTAEVTWQFVHLPLTGPFAISANGDDYYSSRNQIAVHYGIEPKQEDSEKPHGTFMWWATAMPITQRSGGSSTTTPVQDSMVGIGSPSLPVTCVDLLSECSLVSSVQNSHDSDRTVLLLKPTSDPRAVILYLQQLVTKKGFGVVIQVGAPSSPSVISSPASTRSSQSSTSGDGLGTQRENAANARTVALSVPGMSCGSCAAGLQTKLTTQLGGVIASSVSKPLDQAIVTIDKGTPVDAVVSFVQDKYPESTLISVNPVLPQEVLCPSSAVKSFPFAPPVPGSGDAMRRRCDNPKCKCAHCECMDCMCNDEGEQEMSVQNSFDMSGGLRKLKLTMIVEGMTCGGCAFGIATKLQKQFEGRGLVGADGNGTEDSTVVDFASSTATVYFTNAANAITAAEVESFVTGLGYTVSNIEVTDVGGAEPRSKSYVMRSTIGNITGMSCSACAARIQAKLEDTPGVVRNSDWCVSVVFADREAVFVHDIRVCSVGQALQLITDLGYTQSTLKESVPVRSSTGDKKASPLPSPTTANPPIAGSLLPTAPSKSETCSMVVQGMTCASCAFRIETSLLKLPYVSKATVNFATANATVEFDVSKGDSGMLSMKIEDLGYGVVIQGDPDDENGDNGMSAVKEALERNDERESYKKMFLMALPCAVFLFVISVLSSPEVGWFPGFTRLMRTDRFGQVSYLDIIELAVSTPVVVVFGKAFFVRAWKGLQHKSFTMDTLVAVGVGSAYGFSILMMLVALASLGRVKVYFDAAATLLTFMLLGKYLEAKAKKGTSGALVQLMSLAPDTAILVSSADIEQEVPVSQVKIKDVVRVPSGSRIPVDGLITKGASAVDESLITGESVPVDKAVGDKAIAGTLCLSSDLFVSATQVGSKTMISRILRTVQDAQTTKPAVQRLADEVAGVFVPVILCFASFAFVVWIILSEVDAYPESWRNGNSKFIFSFSFFLSSIVVACPCAMGLATPTAVMVGTGIGAQNGILIKDGPTLEKARKVAVVLFDKTGTLTQGLLSVAVTKAFPPLSQPALNETLIRQIVGTVESRSTHPVAQALAKTFGKLDHVSDLVVETHAGSGVSAKVTFDNNGASTVVEVLVGKPKMMATSGVPTEETMAMEIEEAEKAGNTVIVAAIDKRIALIVGLSDEPKDSAAGCVWQLQEQGIEVFMVSGDQPAAARAIAAKVGIQAANVHAEVLPWNKGDIVKQHQQSGKIVCFVGDGLNDAPALAQADVGVALGAGTEVAIDSADAVLVKNSLQDLVTFLDLSGATIRRVYFNFAWAFGYNVVMLPIASGMLFPLGWQMQMPPVVAGGLMVCSSLSVLGSSLALKLYKPPAPKK